MSSKCSAMQFLLNCLSGHMVASFRCILKADLSYKALRDWLWPPSRKFQLTTELHELCWQPSRAKGHRTELWTFVNYWRGKDVLLRWWLVMLEQTITLQQNWVKGSSEVGFHFNCFSWQVIGQWYNLHRLMSTALTQKCRQLRFYPDTQELC